MLKLAQFLAQMSALILPFANPTLMPEKVFGLQLPKKC
jgi:hypothetical protein